MITLTAKKFGRKEFRQNIFGRFSPYFGRFFKENSDVFSIAYSANKLYSVGKSAPQGTGTDKSEQR